ncbi:Protein of unknown function [Bacillus mycoides]|nr:Protein of unknown function [Bacillus mycoides]
MTKSQPIFLFKDMDGTLAELSRENLENDIAAAKVAE